MNNKENKSERDYSSFSPVELYRLILGLGLHGGVPFMEELPDSFLIPAEIMKDAASATQQTIKDKTGRTQCIYWDGKGYHHDRVYPNNLWDIRPSTIYFLRSLIYHKALFYWRTDREKASFIPQDIAMALMLPGFAFIHAIVTPDDIHLMVQTKRSAQLPIMHWVSEFQGRYGYPFKALDNYDLGGIAQFLQKRGFGMYQLTPSENTFNSVSIDGFDGYKFQRITP